MTKIYTEMFHVSIVMLKLLQAAAAWLHDNCDAFGVSFIHFITHRWTPFRYDEKRRLGTYINTFCART